MHTFESPKSFYSAVDADPTLLGRLEFIVTDFHFAEGVAENGLGFGKRMKEVFDKPILLSSNADFRDEEVQGCVDLVKIGRAHV